MRLALGTLLAIGALGLSAAQAAPITLYEEDFTGQEGEGLVGPVLTATTYHSSNGQWSISTGTPSRLINAFDYAVVEDNNPFFSRAVLPGDLHFQFSDVNEPVVWSTTTIDISNATNVKVSMDIFELGRMNSFASVEVSYSVDGGAFQQFFRAEDDFSDPDGEGSDDSRDPGNVNPLILKATTDIPLGSTLVLNVVVDLGLFDRSIGLDNILVTSEPDPDPVPLPGALPLMAAGLGVLALRRRRSQR